MSAVDDTAEDRIRERRTGERKLAKKTTDPVVARREATTARILSKAPYRRRRFNMRFLPTVLVAMVVGFGCARTEQDAGAEVERVTSVNEREIAAFKAGDANALAEIFTEDAVLMPPGEARKEGRQAIRAWAEGVSSAFTVDGGYTSSEVEIAGDWAIERYAGRLVLTPKAGGEPIQEIIKGIHIYRRQADGTWRIAQDVWNSDAAAQ